MSLSDDRALEWEAANCLRVDHATVEAVAALGAAGVRPVLLKGPVIGAWLYTADRSRRPYNDADLLVAPDQLDRSAEVLTRLGYRCPLRFSRSLPHARPRHAECWFRSRDRAAVDLHRSIHRTERLDPRVVWAAATNRAEHTEVLGSIVETPGEPFRLLHLVLHLGATDHPGSRAWTDLEVALGQVPIDRWHEAAALARNLGVEATFGPLLRLAAGGGTVADEIGASTDWPRALRWDFNARSYASRFLVEVAERPWPDGVLLMAEKLLPPPRYLRATREVGPGPRELFQAYCDRLSRWRRRARGITSVRRPPTG